MASRHLLLILGKKMWLPNIELALSLIPSSTAAWRSMIGLPGISRKSAILPALLDKVHQQATHLPTFISFHFSEKSDCWWQPLWRSSSGAGAPGSLPTLSTGHRGISVRPGYCYLLSIPGTVGAWQLKQNVDLVVCEEVEDIDNKTWKNICSVRGTTSRSFICTETCYWLNQAPFY